MRQHYLIGSELRYRYINSTKLLSPNYYKPEIQIYSTDYDRTLQSAMSQLSGLYPPETGPNLNKPSLNNIAVPPIKVQNVQNIINQLGNSALPNNIQVLPVFSSSIQDDASLIPYFDCPRYDYLSNINSNSSASQELLNQNENLFQTISEAMKISKDEAISIFPSLLDSLTINRFYNKNNSIPYQFNTDFFDQATTFSNKLNQLVYYTPDVMARLAGSQFLLELYASLEKAKNQTSSYKFKLYSAHDSTLLNVLSALKLPNLDNPIFASNIIFELSVDQYYNYYVQTYYNDILQNIPTCDSELCSYHDFIRYLEIRTFPNFDNACILNLTELSWAGFSAPTTDSFPRAGKDDDGDLTWYGWLAIIFCASLLLALTLACIVLFKSLKERVSSRHKLLEMRTN